jgi:hypothetical protein
VDIYCWLAGWPLLWRLEWEKETNGTWGNERYGPSLLCLCWPLKKERDTHTHRRIYTRRRENKKERKNKHLWKKSWKNRKREEADKKEKVVTFFLDEEARRRK